MQRYSKNLIEEVRYLRTQGKTYGEINAQVGKKIPKGTLSGWCKNISLLPEYAERIAVLNVTALDKARLMALEVNRVKREKYLHGIRLSNIDTAKVIHSVEAGKIALAMLCLGEASKYTNGRRAFTLGNSDPRIIVIFLELLKKYYNFDIEKVRCTVQCRADQNVEDLESFWRDVVKIPQRLFYKAQIDPRTKGIPTKKVNYKGVLRVDYLDIRVQLELEALADLVYNQVAFTGP